MHYQVIQTCQWTVSFESRPLDYSHEIKLIAVATADLHWWGRGGGGGGHSIIKWFVILI